MQKSLLFLCLFWCLNQTIWAQAPQRVCGSMEYLEYQLQQDPKRAAKMEAIERFTQEYLANPNRAVTGVVSIPVVVHVIYNNSTENISDAQVLSQIDVLNADFRRMNADQDNTWPQAADSEIEFCMASTDPSGNPTNGITRTSTSVTAFSANDNMKFNSSGGKDAWPAGSYLNIWVCDLSGGLLGYAQFPGGPASTDGVVIDYAYFGTIGTATPPFHLGRTATHEVGHWLNLRHIWGDGPCSVDDFVTDTPTSDAANYGCPIGHVSCSTTDMVQNYMDYTDDACMNLYTTGQKNRMRAVFDTGGARQSLLNSTACNGGTGATCSDGIQNGNETGVDCGGSCPPCACLDNNVTLTIVLDNYPEETSWQITNGGGSVVASGGTYASQPDGSTVNIDLCLVDGCYDFTIFDTYGDGICCSYGQGSYNLSSGGTTLASGGAFGSSETTAFCLPTGGSGPTCDDGIQNGDETGVDCGGSSCPPCGGGGCSYVTVNSQNFDSNWGIWNDGGADCRRNSADAAYANSGLFCVRLQDDEASANMNTDAINLTAYDEITVDFTYIAIGMDNNSEGFYLEISTNNGASYSPVNFYNRNDEFVNNVREFDSVVIPGPFTSTTRLRFRHSASANSDRTYFDDVVITGCLNSAREAEEDVLAEPHAAELAPEPTETVSDLNLFPNPTRDLLQVQFNLREGAQVQLMVTDLTGRQIELRQFTGVAGPQTTEIQAGQWSPGFYFLHLLTDDGQRVSKKFVVTR